MTDRPTATPDSGDDHAGHDGHAVPANAGELDSRLTGLESEVGLLREVVDDFLHTGPAAPGGAPGGPPGGPGEGFEPFYPALEEWVVDYFAPMYARPMSPAVRWCAQWWDHAEAISRLEALWRTWEVARLDALRGLALWYRDFLDPQLAVLTSAGGPFASCTPDRHSPPKPLTTTPAPPGYWAGDDEPDGQPLGPDSPYREQAARPEGQP